jgi:hypothetical protein
MVSPARGPADETRKAPTAAPTPSDDRVVDIRYRSQTMKPLVLLGISMLLLIGLSTWFGYLDIGRPHPTLKLSLAMVITVWGLGSVLLIRLVQEHGGDTLADVSRTLVGLLLMAAAVIHFAVIRQHIVEYSLYGWFFAAAGIGQLVGGLLVVVRPRRWLLWLIVVGDLLLAMTWVITRTYGTLIGPSATTPEKVGFGDVVSTLFEVILAVLALVLLRSRLPERTSRSNTGDVISGFLALLVAPLCTLAMFSAVGGHPFVSHAG